MALYAAEADGSLQASNSAVHSAAEAFSMFTWRREVRDGIVNPAAVRSMVQNSIMAEGDDGIDTSWLALLVVDGVAQNVGQLARLVEVRMPYRLRIAEAPGNLQQNGGILYSTVRLEIVA